jgi:hypothetical protein
MGYNRQMEMHRPQLTIFALLAATAFMAVMLGLGRAVSPLALPETWRTLALWVALLAPIVAVGLWSRLPARALAISPLSPQ